MKYIIQFSESSVTKEKDYQEIEAAEKMMQEWADTEARLGSELKGMMAERDGLRVEMSKGAEELAAVRAELDAALGKVLRITTDGEPVADNPYVGEIGILPEIYSYGHRNVQGLAIHPVTGDLWESELGPRGGDEININILDENRIKNYGWPISSYGDLYFSKQKIYSRSIVEGGILLIRLNFVCITSQYKNNNN